MSEMPARTKALSNLITLGGLIVIGPLSLAIFIPTLPAVEAEFGADVQVVQLTLSMPLLAVVLVPLVAGSAADRIGRRPVILASLAILLGGCLMSYLAPNVWVLIIGRTIVGVAGSCCLIVGRAVVNDLYGHDALAKAMAHFTIAPVVALLVAPTIGGFLTDGFGWRSVFAVLGVATCIISVATWVLMGETQDAQMAGKVEARGLAAFVPLLRSHEIMGYTLFSVFHFAAAVGFIASAPYLMVNMLHRSSTEYGLGLMLVIVGMLAGVGAASKIPARFGIAGVVMFSAVFCAVAGAVLPLWLMLSPLTPTSLFAPTVLVSFGIGLGIPAGQAGIVGTIPELAGTSSGLSGFLQMLMAAIFAHVVELPWERPDWALAMIAFAALAASVVFALPPVVAARRSGAGAP